LGLRCRTAGAVDTHGVTIEPPEVGYFNDGTGNLTNTPRWIRPAKCTAMAHATVACRTSSPTSMFRRCAASVKLAGATSAGASSMTMHRRGVALHHARPATRRG
jgi:hypothetical protein